MGLEDKAFALSFPLYIIKECSMITIIVCQCCEDLVYWSNCTYEEAMNIIIDDEGFCQDRMFHGNEYVD